MKAVLLSLVVGGAVGAVFSLTRQVPPAPPTWAGVAAIVGIVGGWQLVNHLVN